MLILLIPAFRIHYATVPHLYLCPCSALLTIHIILLSFLYCCLICCIWVWMRPAILRCWLQIWLERYHSPCSSPAPTAHNPALLPLQPPHRKTSLSDRPNYSRDQRLRLWNGPARPGWVVRLGTWLLCWWRQRINNLGLGLNGGVKSSYVYRPGGSAA